MGGFLSACQSFCHPRAWVAIVTSSSDEKLNRAKELGADHVIQYKVTPEWQDKVVQITERKGVDVIFEQGGPQTLAKSFACVKWGGMISAIGYLITLKGIWNGPKDRLEEAVELYRQKEIHPVVDKVFTFDRAKEALEYVAADSHFGKVVVKVA